MEYESAIDLHPVGCFADRSDESNFCFVDVADGIVFEQVSEGENT